MASTAADMRGRLRGAAAFGLLALAIAGCQPSPPPAPPAPTAGPVVYGPRLWLTVDFAFDSSRIRPEYYATLDAVAATLASNPNGGVIYVNGHTDLTGRLGYNLALSRRRAMAVADYLAARGIPRQTMVVQGFGPLNLADPANPYSPANRRVEIQSQQAM